ncbi:MAG: ABC transporter ATP-binding protein [Candidatus Sumerlaeia bacterium]|nr:ABC transporter ATP-binding protein [Candidatus Sumerlaeia bacterium]
MELQGRGTSDGNQPLLAISDCRRQLGNGVSFQLDRLEVAHGEKIALTGPSGCGKSTLLNLASGLLPVDEGSVRLLGHDLGRLSHSRVDALRGRHIGFVYQSFHLLDPLTALENILAGLRFGRSKSVASPVSAAKDLLERVGLRHRSHHRPAQLSVGERQRVAIARALAGRPELILADEPTASLDTATGREVLSLLLELVDAEGAALLLVTHDADLAARLPRLFDCRDLVTTTGRVGK